MKKKDPLTGETSHPVIGWIADNAIPLGVGILFGSAWTMVIGLLHLLWLVLL